jgi:hypothetical protein
LEGSGNDEMTAVCFARKALNYEDGFARVFEENEGKMKEDEE